MSKPMPAVEPYETLDEPRKLLPCPFCGNERIGASRDEYMFFVYCFECGTEGPSGQSEESAIRKWNTRV